MSSTPTASPSKAGDHAAAATASTVDEAAAALAGLNLAGPPAAAAASAGSNVSVAAPTASPAASSATLESLAAGIRTGRFKHVIVLTGAGISCSAGIPDFRTPGTGLYDNLQKYNLPHPTAVFELGYFRRNPMPFLLLAKELYPTGAFRPTPTHHFIRALAEYEAGVGGAAAAAATAAAAEAAEAKTDGGAASSSPAGSPASPVRGASAIASASATGGGCLLRNFTQNIDGLEGVAGLAADKLIQAHGGFARAGCIDCQRVYPASFFESAIFAQPEIQIPRCTQPDCKGLVKSAITFFGESLPAAFARAVAADFPRCDLLIVMGTSLAVQPFASLIGRVGKDVPRILINNECVGHRGGDGDDDEEEEILRSNPQYCALVDQLAHCRVAQMRPMLEDMIDVLRTRLLRAPDLHKFDFRRSSGAGGAGGSGGKPKRDVFLQSDCDSGVRHFAKLIGPEFEAILSRLIEEDRIKTASAVAGKAAPAAATGAAGAAASAEAMAKAIAASTAAPSPSKAPAAASSAAAASASPSKPASSSSAPRFAVGFDFDHTLGLDHGLELSALVALAREFGPAGEAAAAGAAFAPSMSAALKEYRDGRTDQLSMIRAFAGLVGAPPAAQDDSAVLDLLARFHALCFERAPGTTAMPGAIELLSWLRARGIPTAILTNGWSPLQQRKVDAALGDAAPPTILVSDQLGPALKPDARAFAALRAAPGFEALPPSSIVYIGDNPGGDCVGAMAAGLKGLWVDMEGVAYPSGVQQPDWTVHAIDEIKPILQRWMEGKEEAGKDSAAAAAGPAPVQSAL